ncbi:MAG: hypothetical protein HC908_13135 [Calothrix sp. SM1_7_51]|nr:hypothetical protein [Calothrix sp. SM1_7_51]
MARNLVCQQLTGANLDNISSLKQAVRSRQSKLQEAQIWAEANDYDWDGELSDISVMNMSSENISCK